jgi:integrase/recombinase XerD
MIISDASDKFLNHCKTTSNLSTHTIRAYKSDLKGAESFLGAKVRLTKISKDDLRSYIQYMREKLNHRESSIKRRIACLKLLFKWAMQEEVIVSNPFEKLNERIKLAKSLPRVLDRNHVQLLRKRIQVNAIHEDDFATRCSKAAVQILLETGMRVGELTSIRINDVSLSDRRIKVSGKGNRQRIVYFLSSDIYQTIQQLLTSRKKFSSTSENLFVTETGRSVKPHDVRRWLSDIANSAGIDRRITPHMLRHTCATVWLESGLDIRFVQRLLGHHSISTTEIYTHVSDQSLLEALTRINWGKKR